MTARIEFSVLHFLCCKWGYRLGLKTGIHNQALLKGKDDQEEQPSPAERTGLEPRPAKERTNPIMRRTKYHPSLSMTVARAALSQHLQPECNEW